MAKHKEVKRWAAGWLLWEDKFIVVQATLIETSNCWCLKHNKDGSLDAAERQFAACLGYRTRWAKNHYPTIGWRTEEGAITGLWEDTEKKVMKAETALEARKAERDKLHAQIMNDEQKVLKTKHA